MGRGEVPDDESARARDDPGRNETEAERIDRNLEELLQELRVASIGVQVLFGFLLSLPFTARFNRLDHAQRDLYIATLLLAALATALLVGPAAYHRLVFRRHQKARLLRASNMMAIAGLATVALAISAAVLLVLTTVVDDAAVTALISVVTFSTFGSLWFVLPMLSRRREED